MSTVLVGPTRRRRSRGTTTVSTTIRVGELEFPLSASSRATLYPLPNPGDAWLPLALIPAMRQNLPIVLSEPVSPALMRSIATIQEMLATWYPDLTPVSVTAPPGSARQQPKGKSYQFFTGGVDSFYTALTTREPATTLLYVRGFDVPLTEKEHLDLVSTSLSSAAQGLGNTLIEFTSNARSMLDRYGDWGEQTHGAALASIGMLVASGTARVIIPATHTYNELFPWGSHPLLDPLWTTDTVTFEHHGADRSRFGKITSIASVPEVALHLRVCWNSTSELNCSHCEKCLRTMTALEVLGQLQQSTVFAREFSMAEVMAIPLTNANEAAFAVENRDAARERGREDIAAPLDQLIEAFGARSAAGNVIASRHSADDLAGRQEL